MISIVNLTHSLDKKEVLKNVNLEIKDGIIMGIVGINGAGKSTLLRIMAGVYIADSGTVEYDGEKITSEKAREKIFFLPDDPYYTQQSTMKSLLKMYKSLYPSLDLELYRHLVKIFGLDENKLIRTCSKGVRRQIYIVLALSVKPKYLLLDEAFDGLDPLTRELVKKELIAMVERDESTVIISSHSLRELEDFCDTFTLIDNNTVGDMGDISEKVNQYCKYLLAFDNEIEEQIFDGLPLVSIEKNTKFVKCVFKGRSDEIKEKLEALSPILIEELPMDFEKVFISEVKRNDKL